jgi:hypothetical protein
MGLGRWPAEPPPASKQQAASAEGTLKWALRFRQLPAVRFELFEI